MHKNVLIMAILFIMMADIWAMELSETIKKDQGPLRHRAFLIWKAVCDGDIEKLKSLDPTHDEVNKPIDIMGHVSLSLAAQRGDVALIEYLVSCGADVNGKDECLKNTPLHGAALFGQGGAIRKLTKCGARVNDQNYNGETPLRFAIFSSHLWHKEELIITIRYLIERGASVGIRNHCNSETVLHLAAKKGLVDVMGVLLKAALVDPAVENGINVEDYEGRTPLHCAAGKDQEEMVIFLLNRFADPNVLTRRDNLKPIDFTHNEKIKKILEKRSSLVCWFLQEEPTWPSM